MTARDVSKQGGRRRGEHTTRPDGMCVTAHHVLFVIPLAERGIRIEVDEHHLEDGAVDDTVEYT